MSESTLIATTIAFVVVPPIWVCIVGLVCGFCAYFIADWADPPKWVMDMRRKGKPFSCSLCVSFWVSEFVWFSLTMLVLYAVKASGLSESVTTAVLLILCSVVVSTASASLGLVLSYTLVRLNTYILR